MIGAVITRERTQVSLQKSEERFRAVSETAQDAVIMLDEAGTVLSLEVDSAQRILGHTVDEAIGRSVQELLAPPPHHDKAIASLAEFARTGGGNTVEATQELLAVRKDGVEIPIELSVSRMQLGKEWHAVAILRDITKRKRAEQNVLRMA